MTEPTEGCEYDGPRLRELRLRAGKSIRAVATIAGMSHGHLLKVERGESDRPVTPKILWAYGEATGAQLTDAKIVGFGEEPAYTTDGRHRRLPDLARRRFNAEVTAIAIGSSHTRPSAQSIDGLSQIAMPERVGLGDVAHIERAAQMITGLDLWCGGGLSRHLARAVLRWAVGLSRVAMVEQVHAQFHAAIGHLAHRAGWAEFDADAHGTARRLFMVALDSAVRAGDRNLRAHVLADVGAQYNRLGYPDDCLEIISTVEGDRRVGPAVRMVLFGVKARTHAAAGDVSECREHLELTEQAQALALDKGDTAGWLGSLCTEAHLYAITGHAAAVLARRTRLEADWADAQRRLSRAVAAMDPTSHARARALCASRLAILHLDVDDYEPGVDWARQALAVAAEIRSARLVRHVQAIHAAATTQPDNPLLRELASDIYAALAPSADSQPPADAETVVAET